MLYALDHPNSRILCIRGTQNKISESSLQTLKDIISMLKYDDAFEITEHTLKCNNGSEFLFYGAKTYQSFKSLRRIDLVWVDEATEVSTSAWEVLIPTVREDNSRFLISFNPTLETDWVYKEFVLSDRSDAAVVELQYKDNPYFPNTLKLEMERDKRTNMAKYNHIWLGQLIQEIEGALWNRELLLYPDKDEWIHYNEIKFAFDKIVIAIDPSVTSKQTSDACGLIAAAKYKNKYIILEDATAILSPDKWARKAVSLYHKWSADHIIYESNQGGDLTRVIIGQVDPSIRVQSVHATRGKILRAEPIVQLYEQGLVQHLKSFPILEQEMVTFTGDPKQTSPNSLDAMVYALTDIAEQGIHAPSGMIRASKGIMTLRQGV